MGSNDVAISRVFTRNPGGLVSDSTFPTDQDIEIVVEAEAGLAVFELGPDYVMDVVIRDLTAGTEIPHQVGQGAALTPPPLRAEINDATWTAQADQSVFTVRAVDLQNRAGHLCQVYTYLFVGKKNPYVSFASSSPFLIQPV